MTPTGERRQHEGRPVFRVPEHNLDNLTARVAKMNKRAKKLGMEPLFVKEIGDEFDLYARKWLDPDAHWYLVSLRDSETVEAAQARLSAGSKHQFSLRRCVLITVTGTLPHGGIMQTTLTRAVVMAKVEQEVAA